MSDLEHLHAVVVRTPEPDEPRLAYADAVETADPDRAELIRVQIALMRSRRNKEPRRLRRDLYTREDALLDRHKQTWARPVLDHGYVTHANFMRGFVEWVTLPARAFLEGAHRLYACAPILHVDFTDLKPFARRVFESPLLERLHSVGLMHNQLGDAELALLAGSPHLGRLRFLDLRSNRIGQAGLDALCTSNRLPSLRCVLFGSNNLVPDPLPQIIETDTLTNEVVRFDLPEQGRELVRRFGVKPWLSAEVLSEIYPPERGVC